MFSSTSGFMPHGHCYLWTPGVLWLHVISDALIALAYYSIPFTLARFVRKRRDLDYRGLFVCFAVFILACGTTHLLEIWNVWHSDYWLSGTAKAVTAAASIPTALLLMRLIPAALALPRPSELARANTALAEEVRMRGAAQEDLHSMNVELEKRVAERTRELNETNERLMRQISEREDMQAALKASHKEVVDLKAALDEHAIVAFTDARGKITLVNDKFCAISKYSREELLGQDHRLINSGFHSKEFIANLWETITHGQVWHGEIKNRAKDGSFYWVATTIVPFLDELGKPRQYVAIRADITVRKETEEKLRESEGQFRSMVDAISQLAWMAHPDGFIYWYNQRWFEYTGTTMEEMEGVGWEKVHDEKMLPEVTRAWNASIASGEPFEMTFPLRAADGSFRWFLTRAFPVKTSTGEVLRWCGTNTDVSRMRKAEQEIHMLNSELERRVVERTAQLEVANKELEAFSYSVSHDLRAPLRAVDGFSQAVIEDYGASLPEAGQRYLLTIRKGAQQMGRLIDDLLTFSRLSRAPLSRHEVDTNSLVRGVLEDLAPMRTGRKIELHLADLPRSPADPALLKQVWTNLISNALKYTQRRDVAVVEIGSESAPEGTVYFVQDNGTGFDMRYADKLFGVFQRLHRAEDFEGTGVGLALVQRIVSRHGGRVWARAEIDRGATFYFTLKEGPKT